MRPAQRLSYARYSLRWWRSPAFRKHMRMHVRTRPPRDRLTLAFASICGATADARDWLRARAEVERAERAACEAVRRAPDEAAPT